MKKISLYLFTLLFLLGFGGPLMAGGGPDAYGYTWLDSNDPGGPVYNWIDISTIGTQVSGLADDNSVGPIGLGFLFHYYWSDFDELRIGSNGWIGFDNTSNIAHCFPRIPDPLVSGQANNYLAPFMSDLTFDGGSPGVCRTWTNGRDTFIVTYSNMPFWANAVPPYTGSTTFQVVLSSVDSSITFQYQTVNPTFNNQGCGADINIGIENSTGAIGLECWNEVLPPNNYAIKFYYPDSVLVQVQDATPTWNQNTANGGEFYQTGLAWMTTNIKNTGNAAFGTPVVVDGALYDGFGGTTFTDSDTLPTLGAGANTTVVFSPQVFLPAPDQYSFNVTVRNANDINPGNDLNVTEVNVLDLSAPTARMSYAKYSTANGSLAWNGGGNDDGGGVYMKPPLFPVDLVSLEYFITSNPSSEPFVAEVYDDDGPNGAPGTLLFSDTIPATQILLGNWTVVTLSNPISVSNGGYYVAYKQGMNMNLGTENASPLSRRNYEILSNAWSLWRTNNTAELMIRSNISGYNCSPTANYAFQDSSTFISFANNSNNSTSFVWDFGDGNTSTATTPTHNYATGGTYNVCLIAINACGNDTSCQSVNITCVSPSAAFSVQNLGISANFTDQSSGASSWLWDFGDGMTSIQPNPTHTYGNFGTFTVCLTATNQCGSDSTCQTIQVCPLPNANFFFSVVGSNATFQDFSSGATSWSWDFGDGNSSTQQNPTHSYTSSGNFNVCLVISNGCNNDTLCQSVAVNCPFPTAGYTFLMSGLDVDFTDASVGGTGWSWDFGDGNTSTQQSPSHTYSGNGTYTVCLIVSDSCGPDTSCQQLSICAPPTAGFSYVANGLLDIDFTDGSTGGTTWNWDFGDGNTSSQQNPSHTYTSQDTFNVCLIVSDSCGADTFCMDVMNVIIALEDMGPLSQLELWPNPHHDQFFLRLNLPQSLELSISVRNLLGQEMWQEKAILPGGIFDKKLSTQGWAKGLYFLELSSGPYRVVRKLIKE